MPPCFIGHDSDIGRAAYDRIMPTCTCMDHVTSLHHHDADRTMSTTPTCMPHRNGKDTTITQYHRELESGILTCVPTTSGPTVPTCGANALHLDMTLTKHGLQPDDGSPVRVSLGHVHSVLNMHSVSDGSYVFEPQTHHGLPTSKQFLTYFRQMTMDPSFYSAITLTTRVWLPRGNQQFCPAPAMAVVIIVPMKGGQQEEPHIGRPPEDLILVAYYGTPASLGLIRSLNSVDVT